MAEDPWLTIVGLGEDGPDGLAPASRAAIDKAEIVWGAPRHLALLPCLGGRAREWPAPFADGLPRLLADRGRNVVALASGDPFWFGAGRVLAQALAPGEWRALPGVSCFALAASRLGWALEATMCLGLHAAPLTRIRPHLTPGSRILLLLRDGAAIAELADLLSATGFGASQLHVLEALGGPRERIRMATARDFEMQDVRHPVTVGVEADGDGAVFPHTGGLPDALFEHDGQITKRPVRALTLSTLAPRPFERLWDIGAGAGSIAIEWLLSDPTTNAVAIERDAARARRLRSNAVRMGVDRLETVEGGAPEALADLAPPDAVFIGGGLSQALLEALWDRLAPGCRVVANAVTLETEALLVRWRETQGGALMRIDISEAAALGGRSAWRAAYPVVQWSTTR